MKNFKIIIISILIILSFNSIVYASNWKASYYTKYDYKSFSDYGPANKQIDLDNIDYPLLNAAVFYETNKMRLQNNREAFKHSQALEDAAQLHSDDMVKYNFLSHYNYKEPKKKTPADRMGLFGVKDGYMGENVATAFAIQYKSGTPVSDINSIPEHTYLSYAVDLVDGWMHSPGHRANILNADFTYLGCGNSFYKDGSWPMCKATQNFGSIVPDDESGGNNSETISTPDGINDENSNSSNITNNKTKFKFSIEGSFEEKSNKNWIQKVYIGGNKYISIEYIEYDRDDNFVYIYKKDNPDYYIALPLNGGEAFYYNKETNTWETLFGVKKE